MNRKIVTGYVDVDNNSFDYIRIICACTIFLGHFLTHFHYQNGVLDFAAYFIRGVPVFFCLSGFFCARSVDRYSRGEFLKKRFFRLYPSLWVCLIINTMIIALTYFKWPTIKEFILYLLTQFTVFQFYTGDWLREYGVGAPNGALWTISTEVQFYILLVLFAGFMKKWSLKIWITVITILAAFSLILGQFGERYLPAIGNKLLMVSVFPFLYIFLFGVMCYWHRDRLIPLLMRYCIPLCIIYTLWNILPDAVTDGIGGGVRYNVVTTILLMMTLISVGFRMGRHRMKREWSYHFYLYHMVVINFFVHNITGSASGITQMLLLLITTFVITAAFVIFSGGFIDGVLSNKIQKFIFGNQSVVK